VLEAHRDKFRASGFLNDVDFLTEKADAWEGIGEACLKSGRPQPALEAFEKARQVFQGRDDSVAKARLHRLHWHLAEVHAARNEPRDAIRHVQEYLQQIKTTSLAPYRLLADESRKIGEGAEVPKRLEPYARREPDNLPLQLLLAEQYGSYGRFSDAQDLYLKLLKKEVKPEIYQGLFRLYEKYDRMALALQKLDEYCIDFDKDKEKNEKKAEIPRKHIGAMMSVLAKNPSMVRKLLPLADQERIDQFRQPKRNLDYRTYERIASLLTRWEDLEAAERLLREALHEAGKEFWKRQLMASTDEILLEVLMARHKYADVKSLSRERLLTSKDNAFLYHYFLDLALAKLGEIDEALSVNKEAVELAFSEGNKYVSRTHRIAILEQDGRLDQALAECEKILKEFKSPRFVRGTSIRMAGILSKLRRHDEGEKILRRLLEQDPNDAQVCNTLGYELAERNKNLDEAEKLVRRALDLDRRARQNGTGDDEENAEPFDQDNAAFLDSLAWVLFRKGKLAEARQVLERALAQPDGKNLGESWDHLGDVCFKMGDKPAAARAWRTAIQLYTEARLPKKDSRLPEAERKLGLLKPRESD
jgi:tetratricopeptide (TPR) repeat protein